MRLIDADTVVTIQVYNDMTEKTDTKKMTIAEAIDEWSDEGCPPTVDAEPVRHGHWILFEGLETCSECGQSPDDEIYVGVQLFCYCPRCGAKMDEVTE